MPVGMAGDEVERLTAAAASPEFPDAWYEMSSAEHFWVGSRLRFALAMARRGDLPLSSPQRVLDVGAGVGVLRDQIEAETPWVVDLAELNASALERASPGRGRRLCYDVLDRRSDLASAYDGLLLFDVLEHVEETRPFVDALAFHLRPGGWLLVNVPALPSLYGTYDVIAGHHRRYSPETLATELTAAAFQLQEVAYWGALLLPLLLARRLLQVGQRRPQAVLQRGFEPPGPLANRCLRSLLALECRLLRRPPLGTSLLALARRT